VQRRKIAKSKLQFKEGKRLSNDTVLDENEKWLKEN